MYIAHALRAWGRKVARHDALDTDFLRSKDDSSLLRHCVVSNGADEDVNAIEVLLELLVSVVDVADANLDALYPQLLVFGLRGRLGAREDRETLAPPPYVSSYG